MCEWVLLVLRVWRDRVLHKPRGRGARRGVEVKCKEAREPDRGKQQGTKVIVSKRANGSKNIRKNCTYTERIRVIGRCGVDGVGVGALGVGRAAAGEGVVGLSVVHPVKGGF